MSLFSSLSVSASGMSAQRARTEVLVENLANSETTRTPEGGPYHRKDVVFSEDSSIGSFSSELNSVLGPALSGVTVSQTVDESAPEMRYQPGHPDADKDGLRRISENQSGGRHGRFAGRLARLRSERRGHLGCQRHD